MPSKGPALPTALLDPHSCSVLDCCQGTPAAVHLRLPRLQVTHSTARERPSEAKAPPIEVIRERLKARTTF